MTTTTALSDDELLAAFAAATLPAAGFGHREHLRVAWLYLRVHADFGEAAARFRGALRHYVAVQGVPHKYHETITWAYLSLLAARMLAAPQQSFDELLQAEPGLLDHRSGTLARHYDVRALTRCTRAARTFLLAGEVGR